MYVGVRCFFVVRGVVVFIISMLWFDQLQSIIVIFVHLLLRQRYGILMHLQYKINTSEKPFDQRRSINDIKHLYLFIFSTQSTFNTQGILSATTKRGAQWVSFVGINFNYFEFWGHQLVHLGLERAKNKIEAYVWPFSLRWHKFQSLSSSYNVNETFSLEDPELLRTHYDANKYNACNNTMYVYLYWENYPAFV